MLLKALRLRGFKSFAGTTDIELVPGISVVVGPNGSGKSNVVDSLTWVMGTQGARQLRGGSMEDVIFSGTPERPALGRAEVVLTIDNAGGTLPVDAPEVSIGRVLYRSGESRYTVNGEQCRLLDVVELLSDAGVGRTFHNVVGQGRIDSILSATPEERRIAIEEAAGVLKHRRRRERAVRRLDGVESDLVRLQDLERELNRQLRPLVRQVKGAGRHAELTAELAALGLWQAGRTIRERRHVLDAALARVQEVRRRAAELRAQLRAVDGELTTLEATARTAADDVDEVRAREVRYDRVAARLHGLTQLVEERRRSAQERLDALQAGAPSETDLAAEAARVEEALEETERVRLDSAEAGRRHVTETLAHEAEVADLEAAWRAAGLDGDDRRAAVAAQLSAATAALRRSEADLERLREKEASLRSRLTEVESSAAAAREELAAAGAAEELARRRQRLSRLVERAGAEVEALEQQHLRLTREAAAETARAESFEAAATEGAGSERAATALAERYGSLVRLRDLVSVERGAERAVGAALGPVLNAVVLAGSVAQNAVAVVKEVDDGTITLLLDQPEPHTTDTLRRRAEELGALSLLEVVRVTGDRSDPRVRAVAALLQREAADVFLCRSAAQALALSGAEPAASFVTADGDRFRAGLLTVRSPTRGGAVEPALAAVQARRQAANAARQAAAVEDRLVSVRAELDRLARTEKAVAAEVATADASRSAASDVLARAERDGEDVRRDLASVEDQIEALAVTVARERDRSAELRDRADLEAPAATPDERVLLERRRAELDRRGEELQRRSLEIEAERARTGERARSLRDQLADLDRRRRSLLRQRDREVHLRAELRATIEFTDRVGAVVAAASVQAEQRRSHTASLLENLQRHRSGAIESLQLARARRSNVNEALTELSRAEHDAEIAEAEARLRLEAAEDVPRRELGSDVTAALGAQLPEDVEPAEVDARIESVQKELRRIGPVNPWAVQEFEELKERRDTLDAELADVRSAKRELAKVVQGIDGKVAEILGSAYADVQRHFADLFALLFPGGEGRVVLTDPEDVLGTGIEIEARPSGKSMKRLSLLSGGERSLAALAYLFAIFRARPSPFYVLDEVEAALDDLNLHRFCNLVREFRKDGQIIIVTHQKRTMEIADVLYGVSLGEDGTSCVLSQRIADLDLAIEESVRSDA